MGFSLDQHFQDLPGSGSSVYLAVKGAALDAYRASRLMLNANYLVAARAVQVLASGNNNTDYGTWASVTTDSWFTETGGTTHELRHRARVVVWPPHAGVNLRFVFRASGPDGASVMFFAADEPLPGNVGTWGTINRKSTSKSIGTDFSAAHELTIAAAPVAPDGFCYLYVALKGVTKFGTWVIYRDAISV
jgi:hypothetical protein